MITDEPQPGQPPYRLRKGFGVWLLVFEGQTDTIEDVRAMRLVDYLLKHPSAEPLHAIVLEARVAGGDEGAILQECSGQQLATGSNTILKAKLADLLAASHNELLPTAERCRAQAELDELLQACSRGGKFADAATRAGDRVCKGFKRLHRQLAQAELKPGEPNQTLRGFAEHLRRHLLVPSLRYSDFKHHRCRVRQAGSFIYERPANLVWAE